MDRVNFTRFSVEAEESREKRLERIRGEGSVLKKKKKSRGYFHLLYVPVMRPIRK